MAQPVVVALVCSTLVFIHFGQSVRLYQINVKTAEPVVYKSFMTTHMTQGLSTREGGNKASNKPRIPPRYCGTL